MKNEKKSVSILLRFKYQLRSFYYRLVTYPIEFDFSDKIYFLGQTLICSYQNHEKNSRIAADPFEIEKIVVEKYKDLIWVTYKYNVAGIGNDVGWGCCLRVFQMLIARALSTLLLYPKENIVRIIQNGKLSLQNLLNTENKHVWWSPSQVCSKLAYILLDYFNYVACPNGVVPSYLIKGENWDKPLLLLVPLMLGIKTIQKKYVKFIKFALQLKYSLGIIGGVKTSALYVVGYFRKNCFYLDPHTIQDENEPNFSCERPRLIKVQKLSSSVALGFGFLNLADFAKFELKMKRHWDLLHFQDQENQISANESILSML